ncbi:PolC-type DNA polymerase III [Mycoplasma enhydrae]|uniref:PolC-type DNA polymerase III n=1 Tax=Mycoplasma enhydrae TaxID=2499220 RepID=UPI00197B230B|nr:PolC-type DNA polymerase III [Mycoplasma enhydrae]MBN4089618.1 PolC-type DNA polymerase III [Mycoplasma enhydrae]MCV3733788.1 PolC-type DNA polymerase III [Mycoplasma enhydrae]
MRQKDIGFLNLCKEIKFEPNESFNGVFISEVTPNPSSLNNWSFEFQFDELINIKDYKNFIKALDNRFPQSKISLKIQNVVLDKQTICDYLAYVISKKNNPLKEFNSFISAKNVELSDTHISFILPTKSTYDLFKNNDALIKESIAKIGYDFLAPVYKLREASEENRNILNKLISSVSEIKKNANSKELENSSSFEFKKRRNYTSKQKAIEMDIATAINTFEQIKVLIKGEIYFIEYKSTKNKKRIVTLKVSDYKEAITVKCFQNNDDEKLDLQIGDTIYIEGTLSDDIYTKAKYISVSGKNWYQITESFVKLPEDNEPEKRIDLAIRTNMSAQDGMSSAEEYIKVLKHYGHEAVAITDLDNVQSFPFFYNTLKKDPSIKPIFGLTVSTISNKNTIFINYKKPFDLKSAEYVVFDLETTGLSPRFEDIIEFGASIIKNGIQVEKIQFFLQTPKKLNEKIKSLTNISDDMLITGLSQEEGLRKIYEILKNRIAVAHNASFDMGFCLQKFKERNWDTSDLMCIDTLRVSYFLDTEERIHRLEKVCKRHNVAYDVSVAHRADYDANVLAQVWQKMISRLAQEHNILTSEQINNTDPKLWSKRRRSALIRILAKNQQGLKEMFKILSNSLTDDYANGPKFFIENKNQYKNLFFGSATHQSRLWEKVLFGTDDEIEEEIKNYDYIELPPIGSFVYEVKDQEITWEQLQEAYKDLIKKASKQNKPCVATSDARYVYDYQKLFHAIYINAPALGGGMHWLKNRSQPDFRYLTTRQMLDEFLFLGDEKIIKDIVINNPKAIAAQIEPIQVIKDKLYVPTFDDSPKKLRNLVYENLKIKYGDNVDSSIIERVEKELNPIIKYGYSVIYWISHKLVKRSNEDGYLVGSRGSVGSSIVANLAGISEVNPLAPHYLCSKCKYFEWSKNSNVYSGWDLEDKECPKCNTLLSKDGHNIPFETFLGFEANKVPDIDLNFSGNYQPTIHNLVKELFGEDHTFRAGTISKIATKTAYGFCEKYMHEVRAGEEPWSRMFLDFLACKSEGVKRTTGQHPGGIIIIPKEFDVEDFSPVNYPANDISSPWKTTHFNFESIHDNVLKLDLLGHDDPTTIKMLEDLTNTKVENIPKSDPEVMKLFYTTESLGIKPDSIDGETTGAYGLPEFGTNFVRGMLKEAQPRTFNDLILLSGLSHGTDVWAGNAQELVKEGLRLKDCVCCRDDIMQNLIEKDIDPLIAFEIMERVRKGRSLSEQQEKLLVENKIPAWYIDSLKKIKYMFPKAHATAYVIMAWRIAWYKLYYPLEFYAAYYSIRPDAIDISTMSAGYNQIHNLLEEYKRRKNDRSNPLSTKQSSLIGTFEITKELYARGFKIQNISLKRSLASDWIIDKKTKSLIPPFIVIDGLGDTVAEAIVKARNDYYFLSIQDLIERGKVNSKICTEMKKLGILNELSETNQVELF